MKPIDVCLTIDTEFNIAGTFANPHSNTPIGKNNVYCISDGQKHGLSFLLDTFQIYNHHATFFVETAQSAYFGLEEMGEIVHKIQADHHDIQLHIHPCWTSFKNDNWQQVVIDHPPIDDCGLLSERELQTLLQEGIDNFNLWGLERPIALRTSNLKTSKTVYKAMETLNIPLASNIGYGYSPPQDTDLHLSCGTHNFENVLEIPVTTYREYKIGKKEKLRIITPTACSSSELCYLLKQAFKKQISPIIILLHPFDFVHRQEGMLTENRLVKKRFEYLCAFLSKHPHLFRVITFKQGQDRWKATNTPSPQEVPLKGRIDLTLRRMIQNKLNTLRLI